MSGQHVKTESLTLGQRLALTAIIAALVTMAAVMGLLALSARSHQPAPPPQEPAVRVINA